MLAQSIARGRNNLAKYPTTAKIFLPGGEPLKAGDLLKNPDYAATLRKLVEAEQQAKAKGASRARGHPGRVRSLLQGRHRAGVRSLLQGERRRADGGRPGRLHAGSGPSRFTRRYRGYDVYSNPATSRGGFEVLMGANLIEAVDLKAAGPGSPAALHAVIEVDQDLEGRHLPLRRRSRAS